MSHTVEQLKSFKNLNSRQGVNKLKSYLKTLKAYKSKLIKGDKEDELSFELRKNKMINNPFYLEYSKTEDKGLDEDQLIAKIIEIEGKEHIGDLTKLDNYDLLLKKQKDIGDILWGLNKKGKRETNTNRLISLTDKSSIDKALEETIQLKPLQSESAAEVEKPVVEEVEEVVEEVEQPVIRIGQEDEKPASLGTSQDPNSIVDKPEIKKLEKPRTYKVKKGKDIPPAQMFVFDPIRIKGYEEKISGGTYSQEENLLNLREYKDYLKKGLYKKENDQITKRYEEISKQLQTAEDQVGGMVKMGQTETTGNIQAVNLTPEVKQVSTRAKTEMMPELEQKEDYQSTVLGEGVGGASKTAYDILSGTSKKKIDEPVVDDIPYGQGDKNIGSVRMIGIGPYEELAKKDDVLPSLSEREKSLKRFADFKWITKGGNNNSALADMSPFQKIDDFEHKMRYEKTFKIKAKIPIQYCNRPDLIKRCQKYFDPVEYVPNSKLLVVEQPSTPIGFAQSKEDKEFVRNVLINEKGFDNSKNLEFIPKYEDRPKKTNPFSSCYNLQSYYPNEMVEPKGFDDPLQKPSIVIHPDTSQIMYV